MGLFDLFFQGGTLFMSILSIIFIVVLVLSIKKLVDLYGPGEKDSAVVKQGISLILEIGRFGLIVGVFGQIVGLFQGFSVIEEVGGVSMEMLAGGLKISSISTLYGLLILIVAYVFYFILRQRAQKLG
jgi:biopolymer transport protein ExbB/TolQ